MQVETSIGNNDLRRPFIIIAALTLLAFAYARVEAGSHAAPSPVRRPLAATDTADTVAKGDIGVLSPDSANRRLIDSLSQQLLKVDRSRQMSTDSASAEALRRGREVLGMSDSAKRGERITRIDRNKVDLETKVDFSAQDSLVLRGQNATTMYGDGTVEYGQIKLNAAEIRMEMDSATVHAFGRPDSTGVLEGKPIFSDGGDEYESTTMKYNFKTGRGFTTGVVTEQEEGYLLGRVAKKMEDGTFYVEDGRYTTCDDHDHPHFYFHITRGKVIPKKNIVTGPAYMVLADVPLPIALPFGYFPFSEHYSSGIIFPSFGEDYVRGFYLNNGGYYFAFSDYVDLALRGEIYTKGSWGIKANSTYRKRYRFTGRVEVSFLESVSGDKGSPDYSKSRNFLVAWSHSQDAKANPNMSFSASVNFSTSGYTRNDVNSYYSNAFTENTKSSSVSLTYRPPGTKWSISTTANISQRSQDSTLAVSFPNLTVSLSQVNPFKRRRAVGGEKWYEKIRLSYSGQFQNSLTAKQNQFFKKGLIKDWTNGMRHSVPIQATFSMLKYINVSPSITMNDRMYTRKLRRAWNPNASAEVVDTTYGFYNLFDFNAAISLDTKMYLFFKPWKMWGDKVQMIRYVLTPSVTFSASPDFGAPFWGVYNFYEYVDAQGEAHRRDYNQFEGALYGSPSRGKSGVVSFSLGNNLEMKVKSNADSTGVKKISLIENLSLMQSYNFAADSLRWSNISTSIMLRLVRNFNLNLQATWDPYLYGLTPGGSPVHINQLRIAHGKLPRLASTGTSFSYTFNNQTFKNLRRSKADLDREEQRNFSGMDDEYYDEEEEEEDMTFAEEARRRREGNKRNTGPNTDADGYAAWSVPWSLTINYSINYGYGAFNKDKMEYQGKWTQNLSFSGSIRPTPGWNFSFSASYNFDQKKLAYMNCSISRDLHCFTMSASFVPVGPYKSYNFHIAVKSSLLSDLKYDKRSSQSNGIRWY